MHLRSLDAWPFILSYSPYRATKQERPMDVLLDAGFIALIVLFFAATAGLVRFCANLLGEKGGRS
jgi:hypothetical protein